MTPLAERYIKLVLALGQHDPDYVDAYYGPDGGGTRRRRRSVRCRTSMPQAHDVRERPERHAGCRRPPTS